MRPFLFFLFLNFSILLLSTEKENGNKTLNLTENQIQNKSSNNSTNKAENNTSLKTENKITNKTGNNTSFKPKNKLFRKTKNNTYFKFPNKASNKTNKKNPKKKKPMKKKPILSPLESSPSFENDESDEITNKDVYSLNDLTFDMILQKGNNFKWLVILYSQTCGHCQDARRAIRKVFPNYRNSTTIRFAEIEITRNPMTNMRFEIEGVPYIFLLQNNSIYEMDLYANERNLIKFIETDFNNVTEDLKPLPPIVAPYKVGWEIAKNVVRVITNGINEMLYDSGYDIEFTPLTLFLSIISFFASICLIEYFCCLRFCPDNDEKKEEEKEGKNIEKKENEEEEKEKEENEENENKIEEEKDKENEEATEEEKRKREKEKEKEKEKSKKEEGNEKNINKETKVKKQKKKKKE